MKHPGSSLCVYIMTTADASTPSFQLVGKARVPIDTAIKNRAAGERAGTAVSMGMRLQTLSVPRSVRLKRRFPTALDALFTSHMGIVSNSASTSATPVGSRPVTGPVPDFFGRKQVPR